MRKLLQRKTETGTEGFIPWRPNFRNEQKLPDVKVIRTSFFVNVGVFVLLVAGITWVGFVEYSLGAIRKEASAAQSRIDREKKLSDEALATYKIFRNEEKRINELDAFMSDRLPMREILIEFGNLLPQEMAFSSLEVTDTGIVIRGFVSGLPTKASGYASAFEKALKDSPLFGKKYDQIKLSSLGRENESGRMRFTMEMRRAKTDTKKGKQ